MAGSTSHFLVLPYLSSKASPDIARLHLRDSLFCHIGAIVGSDIELFARSDRLARHRKLEGRGLRSAIQIAQARGFSRSSRAWAIALEMSRTPVL